MTGLLTTSGSQFRDWTSSYRLFSHSRLPVQVIFSVVRRALLAELPPHAPLCACLDDSLVRPAGLRTPGVAWPRDPLRPRFQTNFVRAQRFLQTSLALPSPHGSYPLAPIAFRHAPTPPQPSKKASPAERQPYRLQAPATRLRQRAHQPIAALRADLDADPSSAPRLLPVAFDAGYSNRTVLQDLPPHTTAIGRLRQDAHRLLRPDPSAQKARRRRLRYGPPPPTPEQVRTDASPWQTLTLTHHGVSHQLRFKRRSGLMGRPASAHPVLQLIVIAPLPYRLRKGSKLLYRHPPLLLCTDANLDPQIVIQTYLQRWHIEVNLREEKTLLGVGQAQVRCPPSVETAPALTLASCALLLLATQRAFAGSRHALLPRPKWIPPSPSARISTQQAIQQLRAQVWGRGLGLENFSGFASTQPATTKPEKSSFPLASAVCYANA